MSRTLAALLVLLIAAPALAGFDARLTGYEYPYPVHLHRFQAQSRSLEMAYMDVAPARPNGRSVLLLHGKNFSGSYWADTIKALTAQGFRVVVPDQIGFGKSSKPEHFQFTFHELARQTKGLLDALGVTKTAVVGHSMGGMLAVRFALMYPTHVDRLALVNPIGLEDWKRVVPYHGLDENYATERKSTPDTVRQYMRDNYFSGQWSPAYDKLLEIPAGWIQGPDRDRIAWNAALTSDMCFTQPVVHELPDLRVPTLLIIGQRDKTALGKAWAPPAVKATLGDYPKLGRAASNAIPGAKLVELDAGHMPQVEQFEKYRTALLGFL